MSAHYDIRVDLYQATYLWKHLTSIISDFTDAGKREFVPLIADLQNAIDILQDEEELKEEMMR